MASNKFPGLRDSTDVAQVSWPAGVTPPPEFLSAVDFVRNDEGHLFVTGRAGTGKSTLLRCLRDHIVDEAVVLAPTGLAAVNVGGQTIHSFFGFPPRLIRPDDIRRSSRNGRVMRKLKLIIIDEISMVRSDLMWAIDQSLRINRGRPREAFGGVRLLLFGDLHQLPPVVQGDVAEHLENEFGGPFFFQVPALNEGAGVSLLELEQVYRQSEEAFLHVLNRIRDGDATEEDLEVLNERTHPIRTLGEGDSYVILTPTNAAAQRINMAYLDALTTPEHTYEAGITGEYSDSAHPTDASLIMKQGAKVILLRNDPDRRWVNGTIARISRLEEKRVWIELDGKTHEIEPVSWEARRYAFDQTSEKIVENVTGTFRQFPLRLAWALTIHKSQGLTLDKVYIDLGRGTFAHGQAYVALSRCRSLGGLALARNLRPSDILFDRSAMGYRDKFPRLALT